VKGEDREGEEKEGSGEKGVEGKGCVMAVEGDGCPCMNDGLAGCECWSGARLQWMTGMQLQQQSVCGFTAGLRILLQLHEGLVAY